MKRATQSVIALLLSVSLLQGCASAAPEEAAVSTSGTSVAASAVADASSESVVEEVSTLSTADSVNEEAASESEVQEGKYPTQWDLTNLYADEEAWQADYDAAMEMLDHYDEMRGTLHTAQGLLEYLQFSYGGELTEKEVKLSLYAQTGSSRDGTDPVYKSMQMKLSVLYSTESQKSAYFAAELNEIPLEDRQALIQDPLLEEWYYSLADFVDPDHVVFSEETTEALAIRNMDLGRSAQTAATVLDVDIPDPEITMPDGEVIAMNDAEYIKIVSSSAYDRELKEEALRLRMTKVVPYLNTLASLLEGTVMENWTDAQLNGYETSRAAALDENDVEPEIYDLLIDSTHSGIEDFQRYLKLHGEALGLEEQYDYDLNTNVSTFTRDEVSYDDAVDEVRDALSILGEDYTAYYDELMTGGYIDVYPASGKTGGAFSTGNLAGARPYELFNYAGSANDVSTIAHEMGHAIYSCYAQDNQPLHYTGPGIFTQEVASITNEMIYNNYMMDHAENEEEKLFYLEQLLGLFNSALFRQVLYAEFEDQMYATVEGGESLDAEALTAQWGDLLSYYYGDAVTNVPESSYFWAHIPHFHYDYYVYQYATSVAYAASVYSRMAGEDSQEAVADYKTFLKEGASAKPSELLATAGIDPLDEETYARAMAYYGSLVDEYEALIQGTASAD